MSRHYSKRYKQGCLNIEKRKKGPNVWVLRWRDEQGTNRKEKVGTVEQYPRKKDAIEACELIRQNLNRDVIVPYTVKQLVEHYQHH